VAGARQPLVVVGRLSLALPPVVCAAAPWIDRVTPWGAVRGATAGVEFIGQDLSNVTDVWFDTAHVGWVKASEATAQRVAGTVAVAREAALGPLPTILLALPGGILSSTRLFCQISRNWADEPFGSYEKALKFIRTTKTETGLTVTARLDILPNSPSAPSPTSRAVIKYGLILRSYLCPNPLVAR